MLMTERNLTERLMNKNEIERLHEKLLSFWNVQNANGMAPLFRENGNTIGFDGSQLNG